MWESLNLFNDIVKQECFSNIPIIVFLNNKEKFEEYVKKGKKLKDCFDGNKEKHKYGKWPGAYNKSSKYTNIEWNTNTYKFMPQIQRQWSEEDTDVESISEQEQISSANINVYFDKIVSQQIDFIKNIFCQIGQYYGKQKDNDLFIHVTQLQSNNSQNINLIFDDLKRSLISC